MTDWAERSVCLLLSLGFLLNALIMQRMVRAWAFPAVLYSLFWFLVTFTPLISFPSAHVYPSAMLYLLGASVAVSLGASTGGWQESFAISRTVKANYQDYYASPLLFRVFLIAFSGTVVCLLINTVVQGISLSQLATNLSESAAEYAQRRYTSDLVSNVYQQIGNVLAYLCAGLGGLIVANPMHRLRRMLVIVLALFPSIFVMMTQSAKGMLFLCLAIFYAGILIARIQHGHTKLITKGAIPTLLVGAAVVLFVVTFSFLSRGVTVGAGQTLLQTLAPYWASYTSGHLFAFSDWFAYYVGLPSAQGYQDPGLTVGFYTFMFAFKLLGDDREVPIGIYDEFLAIPPYIETNIYSAYRGLMQDFGLFGSLLVVAVMSALAHRAFRSMLVNPMPAFSVAFIILTAAFIYQSFVASSLTWATLPFGVMLIGFLLFGLRLVSAPKRPEHTWEQILPTRDYV